MPSPSRNGKPRDNEKRARTERKREKRKKKPCPPGKSTRAEKKTTLFTCCRAHQGPLPGHLRTGQCCEITMLGGGGVDGNTDRPGRRLAGIYADISPEKARKESRPLKDSQESIVHAVRANRNVWFGWRPSWCGGGGGILKTEYYTLHLYPLKQFTMSTFSLLDWGLSNLIVLELVPANRRPSPRHTYIATRGVTSSRTGIIHY